MKWKPQVGDEIEMESMTILHIKNTIQMLKRRGYVGTEEYENTIFSSFPFFNGDMAQYYTEQEWNNYSNNQKHCKEIDELERILYKKQLRGLSK